MHQWSSIGLHPHPTRVVEVLARLLLSFYLVKVRQGKTKIETQNRQTVYLH